MQKSHIPDRNERIHNKMYKRERKAESKRQNERKGDTFRGYGVWQGTPLWQLTFLIWSSYSERRAHDSMCRMQRRFPHKTSYVQATRRKFAEIAVRDLDVPYVPGIPKQCDSIEQHSWRLLHLSATWNKNIVSSWLEPSCCFHRFITTSGLGRGVTLWSRTKLWRMFTNVSDIDGMAPLWCRNDFTSRNWRRKHLTESRTVTKICLVHPREDCMSVTR